MSDEFSNDNTNTAPEADFSEFEEKMLSENPFENRNAPQYPPAFQQHNQSQAPFCQPPYQQYTAPEQTFYQPQPQYTGQQSSPHQPQQQYTGQQNSFYQPQQQYTGQQQPFCQPPYQPNYMTGQQNNYNPYNTQEKPKISLGFALTSLIIGIVSFFTCICSITFSDAASDVMIGLTVLISFIISVIGIIFGIISIVKDRKRGVTNAVGICGTIFSSLNTLAITAVFIIGILAVIISSPV